MPRRRVKQKQQQRETFSDVLENFKKERVSPRTPNQKLYIDAVKNNDIVLCVGVPGTGKAQPLDSLVYTPNGPKKNRDLKIGDVVCVPNGQTANIIGIFPQGNIDVYRIYFTNDDYVDCSLDHLWSISSSYYKWKDKVISTNDITQLLLPNRNHMYIKVSSFTYFKPNKHKIKPYTLGALIGDGGLSRSVIMFTSKDKEILNSVSKEANENKCELNHYDKYDYAIVGKKRRFNSIKQEIFRMGLNVKSNKKFIPKEYKYDSLSNRLKLIRGLMDTDGSPSKNGAEYTTVSKRLAFDMKEVLESIGCIVKISERITKYTYKNIKKEGQKSYRLYIRDNNIKRLFSLPRKKELCVKKTKYLNKRFIKKVIKLNKQECQCILIDSNDHLYLTNNHITTHNTRLSIGLAIEALEAKKIDRIVITRPLVGAGEEPGALPGGLEQKIAPYLRPIFEEMKYFASKSTITKWKKDKTIDICPLAYTRGITFKNSYVIVDEAQNATYSQLKMLVTRLGEGSKILINGDVSQSDLKTHLTGGLAALTQIFEDVHGISIVKLGKEDIVRHHLIKDLMERFEEYEKNQQKKN